MWLYIPPYTYTHKPKFTEHAFNHFSTKCEMYRFKGKQANENMEKVTWIDEFSKLKSIAVVEQVLCEYQ